MKKLLVSLIAITAVFAFAKLPPATNKNQNTVNTNYVEYTRRGSLGSMDYVVTDMKDNILHKGINSWTEDDSEDETPQPDNIYGTGCIYTNGSSRIIDPVSGRAVSSAWYIRDAGFEYASVNKPEGCEDNYSYYGAGSQRYTTNLPMQRGTNVTKQAESRMFILPPAGTGDLDANENNGKYHYFADRTWVLFLIKKAAKGKIQVDGDTITILPD